MAKAKNAKSGGKTTPKRGQGNARASTPKTFVRASEGVGSSNNPSGQRTFTMHDAAAARNLDSMVWKWPAANSLRHKTMNFVKGGDSPNPSDTPAQSDAANQLQSDTTQEHNGDDGVTNLEPEDAMVPRTNGQELSGDTRRTPSPAPSISSEEEVVFTGRKAAKSPAPSAAPQPYQKPAWDDTPGTWVHREERARRRHNNEVNARQTLVSNPKQMDLQTSDPKRQSASSKNRNAPVQSTEADKQISSLMGQATLESLGRSNETIEQGHGREGNTQKKNNPNRKKTGRAARDDMLEDYVDNMRSNGMLEQLGQAETAANGDTTVEELLSKEVGGWARSDLEDLADLSTSDEVLTEMSQILSKRDRKGETQYLVVWQGRDADDAKWIRRSDLVMEGAAEMIASFELEEQQIAQYQDNAEEDSDDDSELADGHAGAKGLSSLEPTDTDNAWEDEDSDAEYSDETLARLLSKQEELGMGSDRLRLMDDGVQPGKSIERTRQEDGGSRPKRSRRDQKTKWRMERASSQEEMEADEELFGIGQGDDFDVMDWERPSLRAKRSEMPDFEISDPELQAAMEATWSKDREKKATYKQQRQELREQGLLGSGKKNQRSGMAALYSNGFSIDEFREELADFLNDDDRQNLRLPPLDKRERKLVHEFATAFKCKSKSSGAGAHRFPVLSKTLRSLSFNDRIFDRVARAQGRQSFGGPAGKPKGRAGGSRGAVSGLNYREGEKVGAGASEIGSDNRGRAMLEKMGWSKGTALGAINNKGILMPIEHIVKISRAGLG